MNQPDPESLWLIGGVILLLGVASVAGFFLKRRLDTGLDAAVVEQFQSRVRTYWLMCTVLATAIFLGGNYLGPIAVVVVFAVISLWALREFITLTPTRRGDHRGLFWVFFALTPLQYALVAMDWHWLYSVMIPAFGILLLSARVAFAGDTKRFLERTAKIQAGLLLCVYCLSYAPALLTHKPPPSFRRSQGASAPSDAKTETLATVAPAQRTSTPAQRARLLFFFVLITQLSDVMQYVWGKLIPSRAIAPEINPSKTWGGFLGGVLSAAVLGAALWWAIEPFTIWEAAVLSAVVGVVGLAGGLTMSAIKRDRGVKDFGILVAGQGGLLDRIDSMCFAAPAFFYLSRFLLWGKDSAASLPW